MPLVVDLRDPWQMNHALYWYPERSLEARVNAFFERRTLAQATAIIVATDGIAQQLRDRYASMVDAIHVVRNGFDGEPKLRRTVTDHKLNILFAGELYLGRDPFPFLEAIARLVASPGVDVGRVSVTFVGDCASYLGRSLQLWVSEKGLAHVVTVLARVPFDTIVKMTEEATLLLNLAQHAGVAVPAKAYEHVASGREVLLISERRTDLFQLFSGIDGVICVESSDTAALHMQLLDCYRRHVILGECRPPSREAALPFARTKQLAVVRTLVNECRISHGSLNALKERRHDVNEN